MRLVREEFTEFELVMLLESVAGAENEAAAAAEVNEESVDGSWASGAMVMVMVSQEDTS